jgi:hypothetical protein
MRRDVRALTTRSEGGRGEERSHLKVTLLLRAEVKLLLTEHVLHLAHRLVDLPHLEVAMASNLIAVIYT